MAIIILDRSECVICGKILSSTDEIVGTPPYFGREDDPLYFFNDVGFHKNCFMEHPLKDEVLRRVAEIDDKMGR